METIQINVEHYFVESDVASISNEPTDRAFVCEKLDPRVLENLGAVSIHKDGPIIYWLFEDIE